MMKKRLSINALFLLTINLSAPISTVLASGSIGGAAGQISPKAAYTQGKILFFDKIACSDCPVQKSEVDAEWAKKLVQALETRDAPPEQATSFDNAITVLCPGDQAGDCSDKPDEQELVHHYLTRRYKLNDD
ncbi:MAG: hypothetical protein SVR94_05695 [Pseudomonadota bacterium]|nr:hypothetical protein [Pseudomonadota bacterium]